MAEPLVNPSLPLASGLGSIWEMLRYAGDLSRSLQAYLINVARAVNGKLPLDGSLAMTGPLAMGSNGISGVTTLAGTGTITGFSNMTLWTQSTPTLVGFGTPTGIAYYSRRSSDTLFIRCRFAAGTPTGVQARVPLLFDNVVLTSSATMASVELAGSWTRASAPGAIQANMLATPSTAYLTMGYHSGVVGGLTQQLGNGISGVGDVFSLYAAVPITGWV